MHIHNDPIKTFFNWIQGDSISNHQIKIQFSTTPSPIKLIFSPYIGTQIRITITNFFSLNPPRYQVMNILKFGLSAKIVGATPTLGHLSPIIS